MKTVIGLIIIVAGACLGLYAGVIWAFIGGIVGIIDQFKAPETSSLIVATSVAKILFAGVIGWCTFLFCTFIGGICLTK